MGAGIVVAFVALIIMIAIVRRLPALCQTCQDGWCDGHASRCYRVITAGLVCECERRRW